MQVWIKWALGSVLTAGAVGTLLTVDVSPHVEYKPDSDPVGIVDTIPSSPSTYGIPMSGYSIEQGTVKSGATFGDLLAEQGVSMNTVQDMVELAEPYFDVRRMRTGHPYAFVYKADNTNGPDYFVYESDPVEYVVFGLKDSLHVRVGHRPIKVEEHSVACLVTGALYNDFVAVGADPALAMQLSDVFAWTIDFYRIQKDDVFSVVYREQSVEGKPYGRPEILAARYASGGVIKEAFEFAQSDGVEQYFDSEGNSMRKAFLKSPIKFSRISSGFSSRRLHPVQKVMKAHLGTDYAAAYGTPILAVGDGVVEKSGYTGGNGNYVKIRHNGTYSTQYLHMRKTLVKAGDAVQQGDVIGEVGSTGLATGPHVCFRFWKNGVQVDHRREEFPNTEPLAEELRPAFNRMREERTSELDGAELAVVRKTKVITF